MPQFVQYVFPGNILIMISSMKTGGAEKQAVLDANILSEKNNVFLAYFKKGPLEGLINGRVKQIQIKKGNYSLTALRLRKVIRANNIDIIHASLFASMVISALSSIFSRTNVIWHFHSHEYNLPLINCQIYKWLGKLPSVKKILFVNSELKTYMTSRFKFSDSKTGLLYNTSSFNPSLKSKSEKKLCSIGYIGRLVALKRVDWLIECAVFLLDKGYTGFKMVITGDGPERTNLEKLTGECNVGNFVKFTGFQSDTEMYYDGMDIFALPSGEECLSMAAIDAGVKGIPIVAFDVGGNSEIIDSGETGFIVTTKEEFFEKIYYLAENKITREQMGDAAYSYCSDKFGKEKHMARLDALHSELQRKYNT
ncbi:MAG: glycosyltransferase family 4 protein [Bacteroidales bacterium]